MAPSLQVLSASRRLTSYLLLNQLLLVQGVGDGAWEGRACEIKIAILGLPGLWFPSFLPLAIGLVLTVTPLSRFFIPPPHNNQLSLTRRYNIDSGKIIFQR